MGKYLFTFLRHPGVPPTNNQAEQSIRFLVIMRKLMFGTRSATGLKTHSILPSLIITSMRQGNDPRKFLETLLVSDTVTAQAALYRKWGEGSVRGTKLLLYGRPPMAPNNMLDPYST